MAAKFELLVPVNLVYRRSIEVASSLVSTGTEGDPDISLAPDTVDIEDGDWVTLDSDQKAVKATTTSTLAWPVWTAGGRYDVRASKLITVIFGPHWAKTTRFTAAGLTTVGQELMVDANGLLALATSSNVVHAFLEKTAYDTSTTYPNGWINYSTVGAGYVKA